MVTNSNNNYYNIIAILYEIQTVLSDEMKVLRATMRRVVGTHLVCPFICLRNCLGLDQCFDMHIIYENITQQFFLKSSTNVLRGVRKARYNNI